MPWLTPEDNAPADTVCRTLEIPNDIGYITAVTGALLDLTNARNWEQHGAATPEETAALMMQMFLAFTASECEEATPPVTVIYPDNFVIVAEQGLNPLANYNVLASSGQLFAHQGEVTPIANGNVYIFPFFARAGVYDVKIRGLRGTNFGMVDWYVDSVLQAAGQSWYNGAAQNSFQQTITIETVSDGNHFLHCEVNGKQAASSSFRFVFVSAIGYIQ